MSLLTTVNRCKSCGQSVTNEDKISQLPEALLLKILSVLPTKDVVATSVLSKQWKSIWKMVPNLMFVNDTNTNDLQIFSDYVSRTLLLNQAPVLQSLHLVIYFDDVSIELGVLLGILGISFGRNVRELKLEAYCADGSFINSLLTVRLTIVDTVEFNAYVINCPSLKYLKIEARSGIESCLIENRPELVEADIYINNSNNIIYENILGSLTSVKRLSLKISPLEEFMFPTSRIFDQLVYLELFTYKYEWRNLLTLLLESSPNLQALKLIGIVMRWDHMRLDKLNQPKNVPECLLRHLESFAWTCYESKLEDVEDVAKYILRNASRLKKATFSQIELNSEEREEMNNELGSVVKASNSCQLVFE